MCRRCTRVCQQLQGRDVISVSNRGFDTRMSPAISFRGESPFVNPAEIVCQTVPQELFPLRISRGITGLGG